MDYMIDSSIYISVAISIVFYCIYSYLTSNNQVGLLCSPTLILMAFLFHRGISKIHFKDFVLFNIQKKKYKALIENKRRKFQAKIERIRSQLNVNDQLITEDRKLILGYSIIDLVTKLREGDLDPVSVLEAYQVVLHFLVSIYLYITQKD